MSVVKLFYTLSVSTLLIVFALGAWWPAAHWLLLVVLPPVALGLNDILQRRHTILRLYPSLVENLMELIAAAGLERLDQLKPWHINRRVNGTDIRHYTDLYPCIPEGCLDETNTTPEGWSHDWAQASASSW